MLRLARSVKLYSVIGALNGSSRKVRVAMSTLLARVHLNRVFLHDPDGSTKEELEF